ncbi:MAG: hypothetical protein EZS28_026933 [Streblomastix strix]|uniref:Uncharacterized protein n=1 Tax=Streblomastix strix TaxID=222440 RepID=A0A5J4V5G2_9EUKA|nr:MAG: hypothetical protein EZS28_026933 [Streblomastix strix]
MCLYKIQSYVDETVQQQLSQLGYLISLTSAIYAAGGSGKGDAQFPPQPTLAKLSDEQLEEEGCLEEIEAQIINKGVDNIKFCTNMAKQTISNIFIDKSNSSPY